MEQIIPIKGNVSFPLTLDPGVWIFDDRRIDLDDFFSSSPQPERDTEQEYIKSTSKFWEKEIREGAVFPPTIKSEKKYEKEKVLTSTFGVPLSPFLKNAVPSDSASQIVIETKNGSFSYPLAEADSLIMQFSFKGKPLREDGPVYVLLKDGSNRDCPIKNVTAISVQ
ncbi:peptidyl-prolyl cis-trans isomerase [Domibacillus sp. PGB-M46]|uniref:peptidyl-prolyl cis-trans isomerase n=1 Tax=Domibacillus sp. PGB-M46 TaxID=2910255 RepID=UPI001F57EE11|nr:peptidyl-prolyl cis-trans isomerase [Domibacillus sp. PGB-M46]MCI2253234.1 peptidyl-prolyl cis-trans isomerase [Domibacillus sp. PGB-M46]